MNSSTAKNDSDTALVQLKLSNVDTPAVEFNDVKFCLRSGEITVLLGPNGAGKSTLIKALAGDFDRQLVSGPGLAELLWRGGELFARRPPGFCLQLAVMSQHSSLSFPFLVSEVVAMGRLPHDSGKAADEEIVNSIMHALKLQELANKPYTFLSGGEKQRVHFARAIAQLWQVTGSNNIDLSQQDFRGKLLILDEPFSAQDFKYQAFIKKWLLTFRGNGLAILLVTHDLSLAAELSDYAVGLKAGRQIFYGASSDTLTSSSLSRLFDVTMREVALPDESGRLFSL